MQGKVTVPNALCAYQMEMLVAAFTAVLHSLWILNDLYMQFGTNPINRGDMFALYFT